MRLRARRTSGFGRRHADDLGHVELDAELGCELDQLRKVLLWDPAAGTARLARPLPVRNPRAMRAGRFCDR